MDQQHCSFSSEVLASGIISRNNKVTSILKMKIIPPFKKHHFKNTETFQKASNEVISSILSEFQQKNRHKITLTKTFTTIKDKRLYTILIVAPIEAADYVDNLEINRLNLLIRTMFGTADEYWRVDYDGFPKKIMLWMSNVPFLSDDETLIEKLELPVNIEPIKPLHRKKDKLPEGEYYNGKASILLNIKNEEDENELRKWSFESATGRKQFECLDIPFKAHTPSLHSCSNCDQINKPHIGHHEEWCRLKRTKKIEQSVQTNRHANNIEHNNPERESNRHNEPKSPIRDSNRPNQLESPVRGPNHRYESNKLEEQGRKLNPSPQESPPNNLRIDEKESYSTPEAEFWKQVKIGRRATKKGNKNISPIDAPSRFEVLLKPSKLNKHLNNENLQQTETRQPDHPSTS